ncbi:hypothetical protein ZIOFF_012362 [Zingiber officinale]|uniref:Neprosin PEP catalytic domain-containing protein n=1 Tax=Zingiber officinale TaxID=94328 RepID=A0A8J5I9Q2_ZINOF|nr:hypothetical protein ZIOFF_012362 [Zingiber officinale]
MATYKLPDLQADQTSSSTIYLFGDTKVPDNELNVIQAGWHMSTSLYNSSYPRFFTYLTSDGYETGCINLQCASAGFVSTTNIYGPGSFIQQFSTYGGEQKYLSILISRDNNTGNWWVTYNDELPLGYFPKELLPKMDDYADAMQMGGHVYSPSNVPSPPMGSGHPIRRDHQCLVELVHRQTVISWETDDSSKSRSTAGGGGESVSRKLRLSQASADLSSSRLTCRSVDPPSARPIHLLSRPALSVDQPSAWPTRPLGRSALLADLLSRLIRPLGNTDYQLSRSSYSAILRLIAEISPCWQLEIICSGHLYCKLNLIQSS